MALSAHRRDEYIFALLAAGAVGYLLKGEAGETILAAVREAARGETGFFSRSVACRLAELCRRDDAAQAKEDELSACERELLSLDARGWDNARIPRELCLARHTVRNYSSRLYARLGVRSRAEAIVWARARGLVQE